MSNTENIKVGTLLRAVDPCEMEDGTGPALTVGRLYEVVKLSVGDDTEYAEYDFLAVIDDVGDPHEFTLYDLSEFFEVVEEV